MIRVTAILVLILMGIPSYAQENLPTLPVRYGLGIYNYVATNGGPAWAGQAKVRHRKLELAARFGANDAEIIGLTRGFEDIDMSSQYWEVSISGLVPMAAESDKAMVAKADMAYFKASFGFMAVTSDISFIETFEVSPPYEDYRYTKDFSNVRQQYTTLSMGVAADLLRYGHLGVGLQGFIPVGDNGVQMPRSVNAVSGRSPLALYFELGFLF